MHERSPYPELSVRELGLALIRLSEAPGIDALLLSAHLTIGSAPAKRDEAVMLAVAEEDRRRRQIRQQSLPKGCSSESCWQILVSLYINGQCNRRCYVADAIAMSGLTSTTALRKLQLLEESGMIMTNPTLQDKRRRAIEISEQGIAAVNGVLSRFS